jgi:hypothetical protein
MMDGKGDTIDAAHIHETEGPGVSLYVLKFILKDGGALKDRTNYKKLADAQKAALKWMKSDEDGASLVFQNFSKLAAKDEKSFTFRVHVGPTSVKDTAESFEKAGLKVKNVGTEHLTFSVDVDADADQPIQVIRKYLSPRIQN